MGSLRLLVRMLGLSLRGQLQYRASVAMQTVGHLLVTGIEVVGLWALFERFGAIRGWGLAQVAVFYGVINMSFALSDAAARGFDRFGDTIRLGEFDRVLLRPRASALLVAGQELTIKRAGRFLQGAVVLALAWRSLGRGVEGGRLALLAWSMAWTVSLFYGLVVVQATLSFWTTQSLELMNTLTYGGVETAQYPMSIYKPWFRRFFTVAVPLTCVSYFPLVLLMGAVDPLGSPAWVQATAPGAGVIFLGAALAFWRFGVGHYQSTGS